MKNKNSVNSKKIPINEEHKGAQAQPGLGFLSTCVVAAPQNRRATRRDDESQSPHQCVSFNAATCHALVA